MTDSERLVIIEQKLKKVELNSYVHITIVILGFLGVLSLGSLIQKIKK